MLDWHDCCDRTIVPHQHNPLRLSPRDLIDQRQALRLECRDADDGLFGSMSFRDGTAATGAIPLQDLKLR
jgi:hypothetical protein